MVKLLLSQRYRLAAILVHRVVCLTNLDIRTVALHQTLADTLKMYTVVDWNKAAPHAVCHIHISSFL